MKKTSSIIKALIILSIVIVVGFIPKGEVRAETVEGAKNLPWGVTQKGNWNESSVVIYKFSIPKSGVVSFDFKSEDYGQFNLYSSTDLNNYIAIAYTKERNGISSMKHYVNYSTGLMAGEYYVVFRNYNITRGESYTFKASYVPSCIY